MMRFGKLLACCALVTLSLAGCGEEEAPINRVHENVVDKRVFDGSWYISRTVIDVDYESAGIGTFPGDTASDFAGGLTSIPRIRWVIDENFLYAYRDYEMVSGGDGEPVEPGNYLGQPVAAFRVESHFDIRRDYNPQTGEEINVVSENSYDRRWYERQFMRIDWSKNLLPGYYGFTAELYEILGLFIREPAELYVQGSSDFPDSWQPRFDRMPCNGGADSSAACDEHVRPLADDYKKDEVYHMSFVTQELLSPGLVFDPVAGGNVNWCRSIYSDAPNCSTNAIYVRTSFLKVSNSRQYDKVNWTDSRWDRAGYFRLEQSTWDRSTGAPDDPAYFGTDFLNYAANRHNIWKRWRDASGAPIPMANREVRPIIWHTTPELPAHLVEPSFDLVGQWNEVLMSSIRDLKGQPAAVYPPVECQTDDPDAYCFCQTDPASPGTILNPTCPGQYNPFQSPADAEAANVQNPYDCYVQVPGGAEPDMGNPDVVSRLRDADFYGWFNARMVGSECVNVLRINTCNRASIAANGGTADGLECQERGDMRFKYLSYVDQPGTDFLGIATMRGDPVTGETITGDANIGGPALDSYRTTALQTYDLIAGNLTDQEFYSGEDVRAYLESVNYVDQPAPPRIDFSVALTNGTVNPAATAAVQRHMDRFVDRANRLRGPDGRSQIFSDRKQSLRGTDIEHRLTDNIETYLMAGVRSMPNGGRLSGSMPEELLDRASPLRQGALDRLSRFDALEAKMGKMGLHMPNEYVDNSVFWYVEKHRDWPRARLEFELNRLLYRQTQVHEMGHCLGLRHDFGGSADTDNYHDGYYEINERFPLPEPTTFDVDGTPGLNPSEQANFENAYRTARERREKAGIDTWMSASIMDYTANWYERIQPIGRYDRAAIAFGYGDVVYAYDNTAEAKPNGDARTPLTPVAITPQNTPRKAYRFYQGGEPCTTDAECPYNEAGSLSGELLATNVDGALTQRCIANPRLPSAGVCSSFDQDVAAQATGARPNIVPVEYRFCSDERATGGSTAVGTNGWCNRFDEGDSYREIVRNISESYDRMYLFSNFRRYRSSFNFGTYIFDQLIGRRFVILQNVYQNLIYQYTSDPAFRDDEGAFGFYDEFLAAADILNFYSKVLAQPDVGAYVYNNYWQRYERSNYDPTIPRAELRLPIGAARYLNSVYQGGSTGIFRVERIGSFYDKLFTMELLTQRGAVTSYTRDVPFYTNFYDLFPNEMQQVFSGLIRNVPNEYMPRVQCGSGSTGVTDCRNPRIFYMDFYRGDCSEGEDSPTCRPDPVAGFDARPELNVINGGGSFVLQVYAAIYGLTDFPVFFDTSFQNQLFLCVEGTGDCHTPAPGLVEGTDYIRYTSARYGKNYLAWQVEPAVGVAEQDAIGFKMVKEAKDLDAALRSGTLSDAERSIAYGRLQDIESFFNQVIQLERELGISGYIRF